MTYVRIFEKKYKKIQKISNLGQERGDKSHESQSADRDQSAWLVCELLFFS